MMKRIVFTLVSCLAITGFSFAQTAIDKYTVDGDAVLDFASGTTKGIILPTVQTLPTSPANGTFLLDANDNAKIKMYENGTWVDLTDDGDVVNDVDGNAYSPSPTDYPGNQRDTQTVMGAESTNVDGVLVLESDSKALVLPKIASPHDNVPSPYPGMMCYDTDADALAVFDGNEWSYWK